MPFSRFSVNRFQSGRSTAARQGIGRFRHTDGWRVGMKYFDDALRRRVGTQQSIAAISRPLPAVLPPLEAHFIRAGFLAARREWPHTSCLEFQPSHGDGDSGSPDR